MTVDLRTKGKWSYGTLKAQDDHLNLPAFGLKCSLKEIYKGTIGPHGSERHN